MTCWYWFSQDSAQLKLFLRRWNLPCIRIRSCNKFPGSEDGMRTSDRFMMFVETTNVERYFHVYIRNHSPKKFATPPIARLFEIDANQLKFGRIPCHLFELASDYWEDTEVGQKKI
jgi:hypothetical protein